MARAPLNETKRTRKEAAGVTRFLKRAEEFRNYGRRLGTGVLWSLRSAAVSVASEPLKQTQGSWACPGGSVVDDGVWAAMMGVRGDARA